VNAQPLTAPPLDPTPIFDLFRGNHGTELLTAAVAHFRVFERLGRGPVPAENLRKDLGLAERPFVVLLAALRAFGLLTEAAPGALELSELAREHLLPGSPFDISDYVGLAADSPGVVALVERLRSNRPAGHRPDEGAAFIYREGLESAMEKEAAARRLTLALAGRSRNIAPILAERVPLSRARLLLDVGGGTGLYSVAFLQKNPHLRAVVWDRPEVLKVAAEMATTYGVADRLECRPGDMFRDALPAGADVVLLSNVLHDWDVPECRALVRRCAADLPPGGLLLVHDVFLNDSLDGPLPVALYSAALFCLTEGRAYSAAEYRAWLAEAGLTPGAVTPTLIHCGVLPGSRA
jgi:predicted O-methyltransferase YrrM